MISGGQPRSASSLRRRLQRIESQLADNGRFNSRTHVWFENWEQKAIKILNEQERGCIPIEFWDAVDVDAAGADTFR
jgi:hypothetical protein